MRIRALSFFMALLIALSLLPGFALADGASGLREDVCAAIAEGIRNWEEEIDLCDYEITVDEYSEYDYFRAVVDIHPEFFYVDKDGSCLPSVSDGYIMSIFPPYDRDSYNEDDVATFNSTCTAIIDSMPDGTTEEKLLYIHDYLVTHCEYDLSLEKYTAYDCLVGGSAVCEGYARAFMYLSQLARLDVHFVGSKNMAHAWNVAKIRNSSSPSGAYYYIDCTFDDPKNSFNLSHCEHAYFLLNKEKLLDDHKTSDWTNEFGELIITTYNSDEAYRNFWWTNLIRPVQWIGNLMCYAKESDRSHVFFRESGSSSETALSLPASAGNDGTVYWNVWGATSYYDKSYITVAALGGNFYFSTPTQVWKVTTDKQMSLVYTLNATEQSKGYIYALRVQGGNLLYDLAQDPFAAPAYTGTLSFAPAMTAALSNGKPLISWNEIPGTTQVRIYRRSNTSGSWSGWETVGKVYSGSNWVDKTVTPGGKYKYRVKAYVNGAWTDYSNAELVELPQAPVMAVGVSADKAVVSWNAISGATQVRVYRRTCTGSTWGGWENVAKVTSGTSWADKSVTPGGKYKYQVKAYVGGAWTDYSNAETVAIPSAPVLKVGTTAISAKLSWNAVAGASKYRVYRRSNESGSWGGWENIAKLGSVTGWTDTTVIPGGKYKYQVKAYVGDAWTDYSNAVSVSIPSPPVMTVNAASGKITVSWNGIAGATQYRVYRRDNKGGTWSGWVTAAKLTSGTGWTDTGVTAGVQYKYRVRAYVGGEWTDYSNAETIKAR